MLGFDSNRGLKLMQKAETWTCDGTLTSQIVPSPFTQMYSFMAEVDGISYGCCFALWVNKKAQIYWALLELIQEMVSEKGNMFEAQTGCFRF